MTNDKGEAPLHFVRVEAGEHGGNGSADVGWRTQQLSCSRFEAHAGDDGWDVELESVVRDDVRPENQCLQVELPVLDNFLENGPVELLLLPVNLCIGLDASSGDVRELEESRLVRLQPACSDRRVREHEESQDAEGYRGDALDDEAGHELAWPKLAVRYLLRLHPSPSFIATQAVHLSQTSG